MRLAFSATLLLACAGCFPVTQRAPRTADEKRTARIDELGRRLDPKAELLQLEDTWVELYFVPVLKGRLPGTRRYPLPKRQAVETT